MDQDTKAALDKLRDFLRNNMATKQEIEEKFETLPTKDDFHQLQRSVEGIASRYENHDQEIIVIGERTSRMEKWIQTAAKKIGVTYKP
jgi:uncharacterized protein DUF2730